MMKRDSEGKRETSGIRSLLSVEEVQESKLPRAHSFQVSSKREQFEREGQGHAGRKERRKFMRSLHKSRRDTDECVVEAQDGTICWCGDQESLDM